jgi:hypothetical protein
MISPIFPIFGFIEWISGGLGPHEPKVKRKQQRRQKASEWPIPPYAAALAAAL